MWGGSSGPPIFTNMLTYARKQKQRVFARPSQELMLEVGPKRCPVCTKLWEATVFTIEDGVERCPICVDERTETYKAETLAVESAYAASREPGPQISQYALPRSFPGSIRKITDEDDVYVNQAAPLRLIRTVAKTMLLLGREFSASDTVSASDGITVAVSSRDATTTTLSLTADVSMTPGLYHLLFNDVYFHNILSVG